MEALLEWLNPLNWLAWAKDHPWLTLAVGLPLGAFIVWRLVKGGLGMRRAMINVVGIGLVLWGAQWFADWVKPSLTVDQLFTPPIVGLQAVRVALATQKTIERSVTYTGAVHPYERVVLRARTDGFVKEIMVYPGDRVKAGQVAVRQETTELQPKLEETLANLRYVRAELARDERLFKGGAIAASQLDLSRKQAQAAEAAVDLFRTEIGYATVRAPSDGWVSRRAVDPGQYVRKGDHLLAYDRLARVRIRFDVAVEDLIHVKPGSEVVVEFPEIPAQWLKGTEFEPRQVEGMGTAAVRAKVTSVFPRADESARVGVVEVLMPNPGLILKSDTYVVGHITVSRAKHAWVVPEQALVTLPGGKSGIFVVPTSSEQGAAELREVIVGLRNGKEVQILEGLSEPAQVVVAGNRGLTNGETVTVIAREKAS